MLIGVLGLVASVAVADLPAAAAPGDITFDGESGTLAGISASTNATVSTAAARHGTRGLALSSTAAPAYARWHPDVVPQGHTHASVRTWVRVLSRGAGESVDLFTVQNARRIENFDFFVHGATGEFWWDLYRNDVDHSAFVVQLGRWYLVEAQVEFAGGQYSAEVRIDGVLQGTIASTVPSTTVRQFTVGAEAAKTHSQHYDDIALRVGNAPMGWLTTTPPTIALTAPVQGGVYRRGQTVAAAYTCASADFAIASCSGTAANGAPINTSTLGTHQFTVTATDAAGYTASVTRSYTVTDQTDPVAELRRPADAAVFGRGEVVEADYACADEIGGSGLAPMGGCVGTTPSGAPIDTAALGAHTFTVTATDNAGNTSSVTHDYTVVDRTSPTVDLRSPGDGAIYARGALVTADYDCADEVGGSGLRPSGSCVGPVAIGWPVDTWTLGERSFTVTATDAAGNVGWETHEYTVLDNQPDNLIREGSSASFAGDDVFNEVGAGQTERARLTRRSAATFYVQVQNDTGATDRFQVRGGRTDRRWTVTYFDGTRNVTPAVTAGTYTVGPIDPGGAKELRVVVRPTLRAQRGDRRVLNVSSTAMAPGDARDTVVAIARWG